MSGVARPPPYGGNTRTYGSSTSIRPCSGIRVAGMSSFCTKRWGFSDTEEKYTRLRACTATSLPIVARSGAQHRSGERPDAVRPEARPMLILRHHHGSLQIAQRHHVVARFGVQGDVDLLVGQALLVQGLVGRAALHACRLGVHGDAHEGRSFAEGERVTNWQLLGYNVC